MFDQVQAVSEKVRRFCIDTDGVDSKKVVVLHNGIDLERFSFRGESLRAPRALQAPCVVSVGNVRPVKGFDVLIRAAALVCREISGAQFVIVGDSGDQEYFSSLLELVRSLNLTSNVHFIGQHENLIPFLQKADVFCMLSRSEGFSNALLEAMACGLPSVVTDVGGNQEAVQHRKTGFLVPSENADVAAGALMELLRNPQLAEEMGREARRQVEQQFSVETMIDRLVALYDDLLGIPMKGDRGSGLMGASVAGSL
jgi:glycosyltransferase involved in cell wall biosynthesis